mgnify:CR=1 FL=1
MMIFEDAMLSDTLDKYYAPYRFFLDIYETYLVTWLHVYRP